MAETAIAPDAAFFLELAPSPKPGPVVPGPSQRASNDSGLSVVVFGRSGVVRSVQT
jgi:hypothetical protein